MISSSLLWNLTGSVLLAGIAAGAWIEARSSSLIPKSLLIWPALVVGLGIVTLIQGGIYEGVSVTLGLGAILTVSGVQALLVNIRKLSPWPSGLVWLGLAAAGAGFQFYSYYEERMVGLVWIAIGVTKVVRQRSAALEGGTPVWIQLLYFQAVLLAAYR